MQHCFVKSEVAALQAAAATAADTTMTATTPGASLTTPETATEVAIKEVHSDAAIANNEA